MTFGDDSFNHSLDEIFETSTFAGLLLLLGSVGSASAQTVRERLKQDPGFRVYAVVFGVTATTKSTSPAVRLVEVIFRGHFRSQSKEVRF